MLPYALDEQRADTQLLYYPSTYWLEVGVMGDLLGSPLFFNSFIITASNISHR